jgi:putative hydrolase of the HAD superfamily
VTKFDVLAFDADDTLWHSERLYAEAQKRFTQMLAKYHDPVWINERVYQTEIRNIQHFGYGIKAFALSLIETALELTEGRIAGGEIQAIVDWARKMLNSEIELLPHVSEVIPQLSNRYSMLLITKGDLLEQETKIEKSGLGKYFHQIEIVSQKTFESYTKLLGKHSIEPGRFMMVGNSLPSDILPVLKLGGSAVHIPYEITWLHETAAQPPRDHAGYYELEHMGQLPPLLERINPEQG